MKHQEGPTGGKKGKSFEEIAARAWDLGHAGIKYVEYVGHSAKDAGLAFEEAASSLVGGVGDVFSLRRMKVKSLERRFEKLQSTPKRVEKQRAKVLQKALGGEKTLWGKKTLGLRGERRVRRETLAEAREDILARIKDINATLNENLVVKDVRKSIGEAEAIAGGPMRRLRATSDIPTLSDPDLTFIYEEPAEKPAEGEVATEGTSEQEEAGVEPVTVKPFATVTFEEITADARLLKDRLTELIESTTKDIADDLQGTPYTERDARGRVKKVHQVDQKDVPQEKTEALLELKDVRKDIDELIATIQDFHGNMDALDDRVVRAESAFEKQKASRDLPENIALEHADAVDDVERTQMRLHVVQLRRLHTQRMMRETKQAVLDLRDNKNYKRTQREEERKGQENAVLWLEKFAELAERYKSAPTLRRNLTPTSTIEGLDRRPVLYDVEQVLARVSLPKPVRSAVDAMIRNKYLRGNGRLRPQDYKIYRYAPVTPVFIEQLIDVVRYREKPQVTIPDRIEQSA